MISYQKSMQKLHISVAYEYEASEGSYYDHNLEEIHGWNKFADKVELRATKKTD